MDSEEWKRCIVTNFDLVGIKQAAAQGLGSQLMMRLHSLASAKIDHGLPEHAHGYIWNDSVLLLSYNAETPSARARVLRELSEFRTFLEAQLGTSAYAICVMGRAFPQNPLQAAVFDGSIGQQPRSTVLKTSSWAMANCFAVEKDLRGHRADWYIDSRVTRDVLMAEPFATGKVEMLPRHDKRPIHMFKGDLEVAG